RLQRARTAARAMAPRGPVRAMARTARRPVRGRKPLRVAWPRGIPEEPLRPAEHVGALRSAGLDLRADGARRSRTLSPGAADQARHSQLARRLHRVSDEL